MRKTRLFFSLSYSDLCDWDVTFDSTPATLYATRHTTIHVTFRAISSNIVARLFQTDRANIFLNESEASTSYDSLCARFPARGLHVCALCSDWLVGLWLLI